MSVREFHRQYSGYNNLQKQTDDKLDNDEKGCISLGLFGISLNSEHANLNFGINCKFCSGKIILLSGLEWAQ